MQSAARKVAQPPVRACVCKHKWLCSHALSSFCPVHRNFELKDTQEILEGSIGFLIQNWCTSRRVWVNLFTWHFQEPFRKRQLILARSEVVKKEVYCLPFSWISNAEGESSWLLQNSHPPFSSLGRGLKGQHDSISIYLCFIAFNGCCWLIGTHPMS